jgi:hypothetical protein
MAAITAGRLSNVVTAPDPSALTAQVDSELVIADNGIIALTMDAGVDDGRLSTSVR